jgi:hypothetical protein
MNKIIVFLCLTPTLVFSQLKEMFPEQGRLIDKSPEGEIKFAKHQKMCEQLWQRLINTNLDDLSPEDRKLVESCEDEEGYYDVEAPGCSWYCGGGPNEITASSSLPPGGSITYAASNAHDLSYKTAWVEGVPGYGIGESLTYRFNPESPRITEIIVVNGYVKSEKAWRENSRVKKLKLYVNNKPYAFLNLADSRHEQHFTVEPLGNNDRANWDLLKQQPPWTLKFEIVEVYKGTKYDDTAISEIYFNGLDVHCVAAETRVTMADGTEKSIHEIKRGDHVLSYNYWHQAYLPARVTDVFASPHGSLQRYIFDGFEINATDDHPFLLEGNRWASLNPEKSMTYTSNHGVVIRLLQPGDRVSVASPEGFATLNKTEPLTEQRLTYTLQLDIGTNFIANGIIVKAEPKRPDPH